MHYLFFFKQKTAYELRISDWSSDVCSSDLSTPDPRLQQLLSSLTRHLHAYVKEVEPTIEEWDYAIDYLTRTGQICDDKRRSDKRRVGKESVRKCRSRRSPYH